MVFQISPTVRFHRIRPDRSLTVDAGAGDTRGTFSLDVDEPEEFYSWLMSIVDPMEFDALVGHAANSLSISLDESKDLVEMLAQTEILSEHGHDSAARRLVDAWASFGWRDAAEFHTAHYGMSFLPDCDGGVTYGRIFSELLENPGPVGEQPDHYAPKATSVARSVQVEPLADSVTLEDVFQRARPINKFTGPSPDLARVMGGLVDAVGVQRIVGGSLGAHQQRSYPSGGARHPFEVYLVSKGHDELGPGAFWFDPVTHELHPRESRVAAEVMNAACYGKGGIVSSRLALAVTCRWLRHSWKYRYNRSYRMILLELGHLVQSVNLSMRARGVDVYQCPSVDDDKWLQLLDIPDDGQEGPLYVLGLGTGGRV